MASATVLYVEDEEFDVLFMRRAFKKLGLDQNLQVVTDGQQAIDYLSGTAPYSDRRQHPLPAVVLLDLNLPMISGFEVLRWLRDQAELRTLPVVVFSSSGRPEDRTEAGQLGANEFMQKPGSGLEFPVMVQKLKERWLAGSVHEPVPGSKTAG